MKESILYIKGMDCEVEAGLVRASLNGLKGIEGYEINLMSRSLKVKYAPSVLSEQSIVQAIARTGSEDNVLSIAASIERRSEHILADVVLRKGKERGVAIEDVKDFKAIAGLGATAKISGNSYTIGSIALFNKAVARMSSKAGKSIVQ